jgi:ribosomal protein S18 acetylase RimI-like enzyme
MIIPARKEHRSFVLSTWIRSYREAFSKDLSYDTIHENESKFAEEAFDSGLVFVDTSDGYSINGWVCGVHDKVSVLHWVYVPPELRGMGVASKLIQETLGSKPEVSRCPRSAKNSKLPVGRWNPYRIREIPV